MAPITAETSVAEVIRRCPSARRIFDAALWRKDQPLRVVLIGTDFEVRVWEKLLDIPMGRLTTYSDLAARAGALSFEERGAAPAGEHGRIAVDPALSGDVVLAQLGRQFLAGNVNQRKLLVREQLKKLGLFSYLVRLLRGQEDKSLTKEVVLEHLAMLLPNEPPEKLFSTIVNWGRFAELFGYNKDEDRFYLDQE